MQKSEPSEDFEFPDDPTLFDAEYSDPDIEIIESLPVNAQPRAVGSTQDDTSSSVIVDIDDCNDDSEPGAENTSIPSLDELSVIELGEDDLELVDAAPQQVIRQSKTVALFEDGDPVTRVPLRSTTQSRALSQSHSIPEQVNSPPRRTAISEEFEDEKTTVADSDGARPIPAELHRPTSAELHRPTPAKVYGVDAQGHRLEFVFDGPLTTCGRGRSSDLRLASDGAVSRKHFVINRLQDGTYVIADQGSINGTMLNGIKISQSELFHGDRIQVGESKLHFVHSPTPPTRERQITPAPGHTSTEKGSRWKMGNTFGTHALLLIVVLLAFDAYQYWLSTSSHVNANTVHDAMQAYMKGIAAANDEKWDQAAKQFNAAKEQNPDLTAIPNQLQRAMDERKAQQTLAGLQTTLAEARSGSNDASRQKALQRTKALLETIPVKSVYYEEGRQLLLKVPTRRDDSPQPLAKASADTPGSMPETKANIPTQTDDLSDPIAAPDVEEVEVLEQEVSQKDDSKEPTEESWKIDQDSQSKKTARRAKSFREGFALYANKKFDKAKKLFRNLSQRGSNSDRERARKTLARVEEFHVKYRSGRKAYALRDWAKASDELERAFQLDRQVMGGTGAFAKELAPKIATAKGHVGMTFFETGQYALSFKQMRQASKFRASIPTVSTLRRALDKKARELFEQAVKKGKGNPAEAKKICRIVMSMVSVKSELYLNARKLERSL
jgi:tetratricopeptide (TPR) repeat protein